MNLEEIFVCPVAEILIFHKSGKVKMRFVTHGTDCELHSRRQESGNHDINLRLLPASCRGAEFQCFMKIVVKLPCSHDSLYVFRVRISSSSSNRRSF